MHLPAMYEIVYFPQLGQHSVFWIFFLINLRVRKKKKRFLSFIFFVFIISELELLLV